MTRAIAILAVCAATVGAFVIGVGVGASGRTLPTPTPRIVYVPSPVPSTVYVPSPVPVPEDRRECLAQIERLTKSASVAYETLQAIGDQLLTATRRDLAEALIAIVDTWTTGAERVGNLEHFDPRLLIEACN